MDSTKNNGHCMLFEASETCCADSETAARYNLSKQFSAPLDWKSVLGVEGEVHDRTFFVSAVRGETSRKLDARHHHLSFEEIILPDLGRRELG